ncbi:hypothetical protein BJ508DRAFT_309154 [Ascobolus immersus RN42]|uniref:Uncharacterized protein n=1 Tax=Ascobolus immersus RN42 TaxID=1160509 RepID=A0A3N4HZH8_ASCIM|nr:hypothetical protein BJ508DRAFT_309154 [Ascobolus immersus RN42]
MPKDTTGKKERGADRYVQYSVSMRGQQRMRVDLPDPTRLTITPPQHTDTITIQTEGKSSVFIDASDPSLIKVGLSPFTATSNPLRSAITTTIGPTDSIATAATTADTTGSKRNKPEKAVNLKPDQLPDDFVTLRNVRVSSAVTSDPFARDEIGDLETDGLCRIVYIGAPDSFEGGHKRPVEGDVYDLVKRQSDAGNWGVMLRHSDNGKRGGWLREGENKEFVLQKLSEGHVLQGKVTCVGEKWGPWAGGINNWGRIFWYFVCNRGSESEETSCFCRKSVDEPEEQGESGDETE